MVRLKAYRLLGLVFLGVGALGALLPLLPATPFVLLSAACFARSSERWHNRLLASNTFGPMIRNWEQKRCVSCKVKAIAIVSMILVGGFSIVYAVESETLRIIGAILLLIGFITVSTLKTCQQPSESEPPFEA